MDVIPPRLPEVPDPEITRRFAQVRPPESPAEADPGPRIEHPSTRWEPRSLLKFSLTAADVDARFEIHEATSRVTVTMYDRETGEVLREVPSRHVLDVIASLTTNGLQVDTTS